MSSTRRTWASVPATSRFREHILRAPAPFRVAHEPVAENVLLADNGEVRRLETLFERDDGERQRAGASRRRLMERGDELQGLEAVFGEHMAQALARAVGPAGDDDGKSAFAQCADMGDRGVENVGVLVLALGREIASNATAAVDEVS